MVRIEVKACIQCPFARATNSTHEKVCIAPAWLYDGVPKKFGGDAMVGSIPTDTTPDWCPLASVQSVTIALEENGGDSSG